MPVAGRASRLQPIPGSKALLPIGYRDMPDGTVRPKVISHYILEKYRKAGASKAFFIMNEGKWDIFSYYGDGSDPDVDLSIGYLMVGVPYGTPYTLNQAYPFTQNAMVLLGFPDIMFDPEDAFSQLLAAQESSGADVVLGLYKVQNEQQSRGSDMVRFDETGRIHEIVIKPPQTDLTHSWVNAAWSPAFSQFMYEYLAKDRELREKDPDAMPEIFVGHVIIAAMEAGLTVQGVPFPDGTYLDIGTPKAWQEAYQRFS